MTKISPIPKKGNFVALYTMKSCGPCKMFKPIFESVTKGLSESIQSAVIDTEEFQKEAQEALVMSVPTVSIYVDGVAVAGFPGMTDAETLRGRIEMILKA
jgi:thioredoxin 1